MRKFQSVVTIEADSLDQAQDVLRERLDHEEELDFNYLVSHGPVTALAQPVKAAITAPQPEPVPVPVNSYSCVVNANRTVTFGFDGQRFVLDEQQANRILAYLVRTATITVEL